MLYVFVCRHAGTPINSKLSEIMGLLSFLNCEPFSQPAFWKSNIQACYEAHTLAGLSSMRCVLCCTAPLHLRTA